MLLAPSHLTALATSAPHSMAAAALPPPGGYRWEAKTCMLVPAGAGPLLGGTGQVSPLRGGTLLNLTRRPGSCTLEIGFDSEEVRSVLHRLEAEQQAALRQHLADATAKRLRVAYRSAFEERRSARFADVLRCTFYEGTSCLWTGPSRAANTVADLVPQVPCYAWLHFAGLHLEGGQATMRLAVAHLWAGAPRWGRFPFRTGLEVEGALQQSVPHLPGPPPAASALAYQKGGWLRQNVLFRVDGIVIDEHYQKITVSCSPSAALAALDRRQAEAVKGATTFYPLLKPAPGGGLAVRIYHNPLVPWIWLGTLIMVLGGLVSLSDRRHRVGAPNRARQKSGPAQPPQSADSQGSI